jgi:S-adenosylmethionine decarboxylase
VTLRQLFVDARGCAGPLDDADLLREALQAAARSVGATPVGGAEVRYVPHGVTAVQILAESHLLISTWPEHRLALVEILLCNEAMDPLSVWSVLQQVLQPADTEVRAVLRRIGP